MLQVNNSSIWNFDITHAILAPQLPTAVDGHRDFYSSKRLMGCQQNNRYLYLRDGNRREVGIYIHVYEEMSRGGSRCATSGSILGFIFSCTSSVCRKFDDTEYAAENRERATMCPLLRRRTPSHATPVDNRYSWSALVTLKSSRNITMTAALVRRR